MSVLYELHFHCLERKTSLFRYYKQSAVTPLYSCVLLREAGLSSESSTSVWSNDHLRRTSFILTEMSLYWLYTDYVLNLYGDPVQFPQICTKWVSYLEDYIGLNWRKWKTDLIGIKLKTDIFQLLLVLGRENQTHNFMFISLKLSR